MYVSPGDSCVLCGLWQPEKHQLERLRSRLLAPGGANQLKAAIGSKSFQKLFGPAEPHPEGKRQNIFGHPDSLKVAPKGVDKNHELIAFLKLRSFVVMKR
jgi:uncharacterized protein (DUF2461 family)